MSKIPALNDVSNILTAKTTINSNHDKIQDSFRNTLSLDGSTPNEMGADLDMNGNDILNVGSLFIGDTNVGDLVGAAEEVTVLVGEAEDARDAALAAQAAAEAAENSLLEWKGSWVTATDYSPSDLVKQDGNVYVCLVAHTSGTFNTDLSANKWEVFVTKGDAGAGAGDVVAANNGTEFNAGTFRSNLSIAGDFNSSAGTNDFDTDYNGRASSIFGVAATPLNGPTGAAQYDMVVWQRNGAGGSNNAIWVKADGSIWTRTRRSSGSWSAWIPQATKAYVDDEISALDFADASTFYQVQDVRSSGVDGGTNTTGSWAARVLNTVVASGVAGSLASNQVTLPAGSYKVKAECQFFNVGGAKLRLRDTTNNVTLNSSNTADFSSSSIVGFLSIDGQFTLAGTAVLELQYNTTAAKTGNGLGKSAGITGESERYTNLIFEKIA